MTRFQPAALGLALALALASPNPAFAQSTIVDQLRQRLVAERKLADDREVRLLADAAAQRTALQRQLDTARKKGSSAAAEVRRTIKQLAEVTKRESELLQTILKRDPASQFLVNDLESELEQLSAGASRQVRDAIVRFGAGDRVGAWPDIARLAASGTPRDKRIAARLRTIMLSYLDPGVTAAETAGLWRAAAEADPSNSLALMALGQAEYYAGNVDAALAALARAAGAAASPLERQAIAIQRTMFGSTLMDPALNVTLLREQLAATRALRDVSVSNTVRRWQEHQVLMMLGNAQMATGQFADSAGSFGDAVRILEQLDQADPGARQVQDATAFALAWMASAQMQLNNMPDAMASLARAAATLEARIAASPADAQPARLALAQTMVNICYLQQQLASPPEAIAACEKAIVAQQQVPSSLARDFTIASQLVYVGRMMMLAGRRRDAVARLEDAVQRWDALLAVSPIAANLMGRADALSALAAVDPDICWQVVLSAWEAVRANGPLPPPQQAFYEMARDRAAQSGGCGPPAA